jgi:hypothetical protein
MKVYLTLLILVSLYLVGKLFSLFSSSYDYRNILTIFANIFSK